MSVRDSLVVGSAVDDERVGRARHARSRLLGIDHGLSGLRIRRLRIVKIGTVVDDVSDRLNPGMTWRQLEVGNQRVSSRGESLEARKGVEDLEAVDRTDEKSIDAIAIVDDESGLSDDLAERNVSL